MIKWTVVVNNLFQPKIVNFKVDFSQKWRWTVPSMVKKNSSGLAWLIGCDGRWFLATSERLTQERSCFTLKQLSFKVDLYRLMMHSENAELKHIKENSFGSHSGNAWP